MNKNRFSPLGAKEKFYILGVSGGPDSMFMLEKARRLNYLVVVAHVNYGKRFNSIDDQLLVTNYCNLFKIELFTFQVANYEDGNFQSIARKIRYDFFATVRRQLIERKTVVGGIVVAHNFEDHLETYKLQAIRKSFVNCWGLAKWSQFSEYRVGRPILSFNRSTIISYLKKKKIKYSEDYTNYLDYYKRNIVRKEIFKLNHNEKFSISEEITKQNALLKELNKKLKEELKSSLIKNKLLINRWIYNSFEVRQRVIYFWLNRFSNNGFLTRKKNIFKEIDKQIRSKKKQLVIKVGKGLAIEKKNQIAILNKLG